VIKNDDKSKSVIEEGNKCTECGSDALTTFWQGFVVIVNPEKSEIAKKMKVGKKGRYALRLSR